MFHFLICDDDDVFCRRETAFIKGFYSKEGVQVSCDVYHSAEEIIGLAERLSSYDAIFLDASMDKLNGIDLAGWLKAVAPKLIIVFVSGYISYALDGYKVGAARYIMKDEERFGASMEECLGFLLESARENEADRLIEIDRKVRIAADNILYVESRGHKITYHLVGKSEDKHSVYGKLDDAEQKLARHGFCRAHQSYLVNMKYVRDVSRYEALLMNGKSIRISKERYKNIEDAFIREMGRF